MHSDTNNAFLAAVHKGFKGVPFRASYVSNDICL